MIIIYHEYMMSTYHEYHISFHEYPVNEYYKQVRWEGATLSESSANADRARLNAKNVNVWLSVSAQGSMEALPMNMLGAKTFLSDF